MKKMSKGMLMTALICGAVYLGYTPVYAGELQEFALDEYVVTAARTETKLVDTPANISVVDAQTIEERHYQDVSEVLKDVPGANVVDDGMGVSEKIVRINGDERVLFLVDGKRVNSDMGLTGSARASVDMKQLPDVGLIERIEVLKGAGGALYGSDAVGGVVNIITKKSDRNYGKVSIATGSFNTKDMSAMYSVKKNNTGVIIAASKYEQDYAKYKDELDDKTKRWPGNSKYENEKLSLKLEQELSDYNNLSFDYDYSKSEGGTASKATNISPSHLEKTTENISVKYDWNDSKNNNGFIQYYHNELDYSNAYTYDGVSYLATMEETTNGIDLQQTMALSENNKLVFGTSYRKSKAYNPSMYSSEKSIDNISFFVSDSWNFGDGWTLNTGVRYDNHSEAGNDTTMSAGLNKKFDENSHAYINWSEVFKAPNMDDLFSNDPYMGIGNTDLLPETGDTWSLGYQAKLNDKTEFGINYFESDLNDAIYWDYSKYPEPAFVYNVDKQKKQGMELSVNHKISEKFDLEASYTYLRVKNTKGGGNLEKDNNVIPNLYRFGIKYNIDKWNANLFVKAGSGAESTKYLDSDYITVDFVINYKASDAMVFYAKGYNIFNESHAEHGGHTSGSYDYPAQSRRFIVGAEYKF